MAMPDHYSVKAGVQLDAAAVAFVAKVADAFFDATAKDITVTSAYRGPQEQAAAMYVKMGGPEWNIYADKTSLTAIRAAYLDGKAAKQDKATIVAAMAAVIETQVGQGSYISNHLRSTALDFRTRDLTADEVTALKKASTDAGATVVINEGSPPHLHVQF